MISPLENNNMVVRAMDFSTIKQNENEHPHTQHVIIQDDIDQREGSNVQTVHEKDNDDASNTEHDAREEGRNKYFSTRDTEKKKKKNEVPDEGIVIPVRPGGGFNITI